MAVIQELSVFQMEAFTILFSYVRSNLYWSLIIDLEFAWCLFMTLSYGSKQQAIHIIFVFGVSVFLFVCFFTFLCESNSNLLTQSQRALSCLMLVRYSIKSLCYNPSSVLIAFYHIINLIFFFFQILHPSTYHRVLIGKCNF